MPLGRPPGVAGALLEAAVHGGLPCLHETVRLGTRTAGSVRRQWEQFAETPDIPSDGLKLSAIVQCAGWRQVWRAAPNYYHDHGFGMDLQTWGWHTGAVRSGESTFVRLKEIGIAGHRRRRPGGAGRCASRREVVADFSRHARCGPAGGFARRMLSAGKPAAQLFASDCTGAGCHKGSQGSARIAVSPRSRVSCPSTTPPAARARPRLRPIWSACEAAPPGPIPSRPRSRRSAGRRLENPPTLQKLSRRGLRQSRRATGRSNCNAGCRRACSRTRAAGAASGATEAPVGHLRLIRRQGGHIARPPNGLRSQHCGRAQNHFR